ncbi:MAG: hypothetical protein U0360_05130 [Dehalococcoidia bacterium]
MRAALDETTRRRAIQEAYNIANGITPTTITQRRCATSPTACGATGVVFIQRCCWRCLRRSSRG